MVPEWGEVLAFVTIVAVVMEMGIYSAHCFRSTAKFTKLFFRNPPNCRFLCDKPRICLDDY